MPSSTSRQASAGQRPWRNRGGSTSRAAYHASVLRDAEFHAFIAAAGGNALIYQTVVQQRTHLHLFRLRFYAQVTREAMAEHAKVIAAFRERDPEATAAAMRSHIERAHERFKQAAFT
jgi:DNA-binding GntR family transcriptional regulator